jgi:hypothetical protein
MQPQSVIAVRDLRYESVTVIEGETIAAHGGRADHDRHVNRVYNRRLELRAP